jgi:hypothetical protein
MENIFFTLGDSPAGTGQVRPAIVHGQLFPPSGRVYFCPICANVWFRAEVPGRNTIALNRHCFHHYPRSYFGGTSAGSIHSEDVPGSLYDPYDEEFNESWTPILVSYELLVQSAAHMYRERGKIDIDSPIWEIYNYILHSLGHISCLIPLHPTHLSRQF